MVKCLITGGAGFIGSHLTSLLLNQGHQVIIIDDLSSGSKRNVPVSSVLIDQPLEEVDSNIFSGVDVVFHLASISGEAVSLFAPSACFSRNVAAAHNLLLNSLRFGVRRIVFTSSMAVYGNRQRPPFSEDDLCDPTDPYGLSKFTIEKLLQMYGEHSQLEWTILRLHNVYGPNMNLSDPYRGVISIFLNRLLREKSPVLYGDGNQLRAFTYVDDVVPCIARAGFSKECNKQIVNLGSGKKTRLLDLSTILCDLTGYTEEPLYLPPRPGEAKNAYTTTEKSERLIGFKDKTLLRDGLLCTLDWAKKQEISSFNYGSMDIELDLDGSIPIPWRDRTL